MAARVKVSWFDEPCEYPELKERDIPSCRNLWAAVFFEALVKFSRAPDWNLYPFYNKAFNPDFLLICDLAGIGHVWAEKMFRHVSVHGLQINARTLFSEVCASKEQKDYQRGYYRGWTRGIKRGRKAPYIKPVQLSLL